MLKLTLATLAVAFLGYVFVWCLARASARRDAAWDQLQDSARRLGIRDRERSGITQGRGNQ